MFRSDLLNFRKNIDRLLSKQVYKNFFEQALAIAYQFSCVAQQIMR
ncbi:Uncharacterized protein dnm_025780 [Desulfonema magnum]|uniref:Uncharacterized protein n=1 Tax=Desulfonema magnum TaxID=45655 RepID=A0A975BIY1_9BACT|nr:Uncharacterized protein dnm_025780 [Desulfonema magnum]